MSSEVMKGCCSRVSQKWVFAILGFFAMFCAFALRFSLSLTIPKMVQPHIHDVKYLEDTCPDPNTNGSHVSFKNRTTSHLNTYDWSERTQGIILGSFYWGYVISHVPGGILAERFGGKHTVGLGVLFTAIFTILTPMAVQWGGAAALICIRIAMGLSEGTVQPGLSVMLAQWVPAHERSKFTSIVFMGMVFGMLFISMGLGPIIRHMDWPGVYYLFGGFGVIWFVLWSLLVYSNPREHPYISDVEAKKLGEKLSGHTHDNAPPVPWKHLLMSAPFWALVVSSVGRDWGGYTMMSDMPKYTMNVLKFTEDENGLLFLLYNIGVLLSATSFSYVADKLIKTKRMSITNVRKVMTTIGMSLHNVFSIWAAYVACDKPMYLGLSFVGAFLGGAAFPGCKANVLDLSPNYAGTVMAISHGIAGLCGVAGPYVVGIVAPNQTLTEWRLVYWIIFVVTVVSNVIYCLFASGEVQEWNDPDFDRKKKGEKMVEMKEVENLIVDQKVQIVVQTDGNGNEKKK